jgi:lipoyl(octanoyl) transferase
MDVFEPIEVWRATDVAYGQGLGWQERAHARALSARAAGARAESLALIEHRAVVTLGRRGDVGSLLASPDELAARGIDLVRADRGGDVTYHGPGQLVAYPILDLRSRGMRVGDYVRTLEAAIIATAVAFGVAARRVEGRPGVWVDEATKLASIGVRVTSGVSRHGLALNVTTKLEDFDTIVPCGLDGTSMTSLAAQRAVVGHDAPTVEEAADVLTAALADRIGFALPSTVAPALVQPSAVVA